MNAPDRFLLPDVQAAPDRRNLAIQKVGVKSVVHPVTVRALDGSAQPTVASVDMAVGLPAHIKGTHMSRFLEVLQDTHDPLSPATLREAISRMLVRLEADSGEIVVRFPFFVSKAAPVSGVRSLMDYRATLTAVHRSGRTVVTMEVVVPVTSLCPCSKTISEYGAHNQRSHVTISADIDGDLDLESLIRIAEEAASCELYGLLKRPDEKFVTERAYDNPKFVEDLVRDVATALLKNDVVLSATVESENFESIHNHSAYAVIRLDRQIV